MQRHQASVAKKSSVAASSAPHASSTSSSPAPPLTRSTKIVLSGARGRSRRVRLIHAVYEGSKRLQEEIIAEVGDTREKP